MQTIYGYQMFLSSQAPGHPSRGQVQPGTIEGHVQRKEAPGWERLTGSPHSSWISNQVCAGRSLLGAGKLGRTFPLSLQIRSTPDWVLPFLCHPFSMTHKSVPFPDQNGAELSIQKASPSSFPGCSLTRSVSLFCKDPIPRVRLDAMVPPRGSTQLSSLCSAPAATR